MLVFEVTKREFRQEARTGKTKRWVIKVTSDVVTVSHGLVDGQMQTTPGWKGEARNVGKVNEVTPEQDARNYADRQVTKQLRKGYLEVNPKTGVVTQKKQNTEIDFDDLSQSLRFYKPQNSMNPYVQKLMDNHTAWWVRKRNGNMCVISTGTRGEATLYSSTGQKYHKDEATSGRFPGVPLLHRYPHIEETLYSLALPPRTILLAELCTVAAGGFGDTRDGVYGLDVDDLNYVGSVGRSLTDTAIELQEQKGKLGICVWDIAFWGGKCWMQEKPFHERMGKIVELADMDESGFIRFPEVVSVGTDIDKHDMIYFTMQTPVGGKQWASHIDKIEESLLLKAKEWKWEGFVVIDPHATYGDKAYNFRGKAERPKFLAKMKPKLEADFIVRYDPDNGIGVRGKGKKSVGVGSVFCYLWDGESEVYVGKCGGGLNEENVLKFADPSLYPMVWEVSFASWTKKGSFEFPEFVRVRDDKTPEECSVEQNPNWRPQ